MGFDVTVYVDTAQIPCHGMKMSHMIADTIDELHAMADTIGLKRAWFQGHIRPPHYDVCLSMRDAAIRHGAQEISLRDFVNRTRAARGQEELSRADKIIWTNCRVKLGDLKPWAQNPRMSTKAQAHRILQSLDDFGQVQTVAIGPDSEVYDGHQRLSALLTIHGQDYELDARRASRALSEIEHRALVIALHAGAMGAWDWNSLSGWDTAQLGSWGMDNDLLKQWNDDACNLREMIDADELEQQAGGIDNITSQWMILIECQDESSQSALLGRFNLEGLKCRALIS